MEAAAIGVTLQLICANCTSDPGDAHLRADPKLSKEGAKALEALIKTAYQQFRRS